MQNVKILKAKRSRADRQNRPNVTDSCRIASTSPRYRSELAGPATIESIVFCCDPRTVVN